LLVSEDTTRLEKKDLGSLCHSFLDTLQAVLRSGKSRTIEQDTVKGVIEDFFNQVENRTRKSFIEAKTEPAKTGGLKLIKTKDHWLKLEKSHAELCYRPWIPGTRR